jgi:hypothetical protein
MPCCGSIVPKGEIAPTVFDKKSDLTSSRVNNNIFWSAIYKQIINYGIAENINRKATDIATPFLKINPPFVKLNGTKHNFKELR